MSLKYSSSLYFPSSSFHYSSSPHLYKCVFSCRLMKNSSRSRSQHSTGKKERKFFFLNCRVESKGLKTDQKREREDEWMEKEKKKKKRAMDEWRASVWVFCCYYTQTFFLRIQWHHEDKTLLLWPRTLKPWRTELRERERERNKSIISGMF